MEQVGRLRHVSNLHVAVLVLAVELVLAGEDARLLVTELEPTLHSTGGVLGTLTVITVRQGDDETRALQPLGFTRGNELVNDTLSVVGKVTELGLPHDEGVGRGQGVTVFETKTANVSSISQLVGRKTHAPNSLREELEMAKVPWPSEMCCRGV
jgi:hypothetical protein